MDVEITDDELDRMLIELRNTSTEELARRGIRRAWNDQTSGEISDDFCDMLIDTMWDAGIKHLTVDEAIELHFRYDGIVLNNIEFDSFIAKLQTPANPNSMLKAALARTIKEGLL